MKKQAHPLQLSDLATIKTFITAGKARFTLRSKKTGTRFTYKVDASDDGAVHFVKVLTGPDNDKSYSFIGVLRDKGARYCHGRKARVTEDAASVKALKWFIAKTEEHKAVPADVEFWHEGRCCRCGRALTVPESIASGIGPECVKHVGFAPTTPDMFTCEG